MAEFFNLSDNTSDHTNFPWVQKITGGKRRRFHCNECGRLDNRPEGDVEVALETESNANKWPDVLGCGDYPLLIVSSGVLNAWRKDKLGDFPVHSVSIAEPLPAGVLSINPPDYYWIDGIKMLGAQTDFEASGFVDVRFCPKCGARSHDISKTYDRQHSGVWPERFICGTWNGSNLFTTDLSPAVFFCTDAIVKCARRHRHTNFRFVPVEGSATWSEGIDYLGPQWPPRHAIRPSDGKTLDEWVEQLRYAPGRYDARLALLDLGKNAASAIPALVQMLDDRDESLRREAALLLSAFRKLNLNLGEKGDAAADQYEAWFQSALGR